MNLVPLGVEASKISPHAATLVKESLALVTQLSNEVRTVSHLLHPPLLDEVGVASALRGYVEGFAERSKIEVDLEIPADFGRLPRELETAIFRIVQESLTNIHRHSGSPIAVIRISRHDHHVHVEVRDEGKGMSPEKRLELESSGRAGVGIRGMRERIRQLGGTLDITPGPRGKGIMLRIQLPISTTSLSPQHQAVAT